MTECLLCNLIHGDIKTHLYHQDDNVTIVDCLTCGTPMLVFSLHGPIADTEHAQRIIDSLFTYDSIRKEPHQILDHEHWHILGAKEKHG